VNLLGTLEGCHKGKPRDPAELWVAHFFLLNSAGPADRSAQIRRSDAAQPQVMAQKSRSADRSIPSEFDREKRVQTSRKSSGGGLSRLNQSRRSQSPI